MRSVEENADEGEKEDKEGEELKHDLSYAFACM
jgi:hypothetical protein